MTGAVVERLAQLAETAQAMRDGLRCQVDWHGVSYPTYNAGTRHGRIRFGPFGRDLLLGVLLLEESEFSRDAMRFVAATLGTREDARSGEEPGRGIHELTNVVMRGLSTQYNAAEVSCLFLILADRYLEATSDETTLLEIYGPLRAAFDFVLRHMPRGLFIEDAAFCGATRYALRSTYWKDSFVPGREDPAYPIAYTLVQAESIAALRAARGLSWKLGETWESTLDERTHTAVRMLIRKLWDFEGARSWTALDQSGPIGGVSSDMLQMMAFLSPGDLPASRVREVAEQAEALATPYGFRTHALGQAWYDHHSYHHGSVWPFEQALIALGADRHGLPALLETSLRIIDALEVAGFAELVYWDRETGLEGPDADANAGCDVQLWTTCVPVCLERILDQRCGSAGQPRVGCRQ